MTARRDLIGDPKTTDYCRKCGESPDSATHVFPHGHTYEDPRAYDPSQVLSVDEIEETIDRAREYVTNIKAPPEEEFEALADDFALALVQVADACPIGVPCDKHGGAVHGQEAEDLRKGVEQVLEEHGSWQDGEALSQDDYNGLRSDLQRLLDRVDARDSLGFLEAADAKASPPPPAPPSSYLSDDQLQAIVRGQIGSQVSDDQLQAIVHGQIGSQSSTEMIRAIAAELLHARQTSRQDAAKLSEVFGLLDAHRRRREGSTR